MKTYFLETFGCQMNVLDSELVEGELERAGLARVASAHDADVILFNTCSVRQHAEDKVLSRLGELKGHKRRRPHTVIGVLGCMAERQKHGLFEQMPHVDLLCGPGELHRLTGLLAEAAGRTAQKLPLAAASFGPADGVHVAALAGVQSRRTPVEQRALDEDSLEALDLSRAPRAGDVLQSYVRVQRGCDKFCTYCIVPFTRGPERSRPPEHILAEARRLAEAGCREVTLLGQTVNSYVYAEGGRPVRFARLLEQLHAIDGLDRIRFVTSFPADWDENIFRVMRDSPRLCPYLHIPAQSGSDRMLKAMKRGYTAAEYLKLMDTARKYLPDIALAGDFIVGFCGETEADFAQTVALTQRVEYKSVFVFKYSPRPGTAAERGRDDDIPADVKARRNNELLAVQAEIGLRQKQSLVGRTVEVLVEGYSKAARKAQSGTDRPGAAGGELAGTGGGVVIESEQERGKEALRPNATRGTNATPPANAAPRVNATPPANAAPRVNATPPADLAPRALPLPLAEARHQLVGRTPHDLIVVFDGVPEQIGALVNVRVEAASALTLFGRLESVVSAARW